MLKEEYIKAFQGHWFCIHYLYRTIEKECKKKEGENKCEEVEKKTEPEEPEKPEEENNNFPFSHPPESATLNFLACLFPLLCDHPSICVSRCINIGLCF